MLTLGDLFAPLPVADFKGQFWQKRHYHTPGPSPVLDKLRALLGGFDVEHLLGFASEITAFSYVDGLTDRRDSLTTAQALALYDRDYTLYFTLGRLPPLKELAASLALEAGISAVSANSSVFASRTSGGLKNHFDQNENFTVQLVGTKVWTVWSNTAVENPIHAFRRDEPLMVPDTGMYLDSRARVGELGPGDEVVMSPGAVLYHPRGSWHATRAASESISLNICLEPMTWYDVLLGVAAARLVSSATLRTVVPAIKTTGDFGELARRMGGMVGAARKALAELTPEDAAEACLVPPGMNADLLAVAAQSRARISATSRLRKNSLAGIDVLRERGEAVVRVSLFLGRLTRHVTLHAPLELAPACERAAGPDREWTPRKVAGDKVREEDLVEVARALAAVGALRVVSGTR